VFGRTTENKREGTLPEKKKNKNEENIEMGGLPGGDEVRTCAGKGDKDEGEKET